MGRQALDRVFGIDGSAIHGFDNRPTRVPAEVAGIPRADFIDALAARKVEVVQVDADGLSEELARG